MKTETKTIEAKLREQAGIILGLHVQLDTVTRQRNTLISIQRKTNKQMRVAARKLKDPLALKILREIETEFAEIQKLIRQGKAP